MGRGIFCVKDEKTKNQKPNTNRQKKKSKTKTTTQPTMRLIEVLEGSDSGWSPGHPGSCLGYLW